MIDVCNEKEASSIPSYTLFNSYGNELLILAGHIPLSSESNDPLKEVIKCHRCWQILKVETSKLIYPYTKNNRRGRYPEQLPHRSEVY